MAGEEGKVGKRVVEEEYEETEQSQDAEKQDEVTDGEKVADWGGE